MEENKTGGPLLAGLSDREAEELCRTLRGELINNVALTGGHLASNLGVVELTVAIHRVFDTGRDRLVFDVGHQCYPHKMLTGRREAMGTLRQFGGVSGFPKPSESVHDAFIAGHASNSVAVAVGMAHARSSLEEDYRVLALIGDGALTGGLAYEGLSIGGQCGKQLLVILNDNGMSIAPNVGGVAKYLAHQRLKPQYLTIKRHYREVMQKTWLGRKIYRLTHGLKKAVKQSLLPSSMFENMGFTYLGPIDGHDLPRLTRTLRYAKELQEPVLLHVKTVKGKSYTPAEENPDLYHGVSPFDPQCGLEGNGGGRTFSALFGRQLTRLAEGDDRICAITAAMRDGTGLEEFSHRFPHRFFDVGIAEGAAVSMAAGMAKQGLVPVVAVYSTFLQRAYDMLLHDTALGGLHVVLAVDRAGLVGEDGETHHGVFDLAFLGTVPGMTVLAPSSGKELERMLARACLELDGPVAVRYPRGGEGSFAGDSGDEPAVCLRRGRDITLVGHGVLVGELLRAAEQLAVEGIEAEVIKLNTLIPLFPALVVESVRRTGAMLTAEDCVRTGSAGQGLEAALIQAGVSARLGCVNTGEGFVPHGETGRLRQLLGLDADGLAARAREVLGRG